MNIFFLDKTPEKSAEYHCDKHVVKMVLETAQMLCSAYKKHYKVEDDLYEIAHPKHPMTLWVGYSHMNFKFTLELLKKLSEEYTKRYNKVHKSSRIYDLFMDKYTRWHEWDGLFTTPPQCMPDEFKHADYVTAYRNYYKGAKKYFAKWNKLNNIPDWWEEN